MPVLANPDKCEKRRKQAASGAFLWCLSFVEKCSSIFSIRHIHVAWRRKRKKLVSGYENPHEINRRDSDPLILNLDTTLAKNIFFIIKN